MSRCATKHCHKQTEPYSRIVSAGTVVVLVAVFVEFAAVVVVAVMIYRPSYQPGIIKFRLFLVFIIHSIILTIVRIIIIIIIIYE